MEAQRGVLVTAQPQKRSERDKWGIHGRWRLLGAARGASSPASTQIATGRQFAPAVASPAEIGLRTLFDCGLSQKTLCRRKHERGQVFCRA